MKKINFNANSIPVALFLVCLVSYGLLIPWLGFYWDDWPYSWFAKILGPLGFVKAFANDRPFLSVIYMVTTSLFGNSPVSLANLRHLYPFYSRDCFMVDAQSNLA